jgi:hypothetical protein
MLCADFDKNWVGLHFGRFFYQNNLVSLAASRVAQHRVSRRRRRFPEFAAPENGVFRKAEKQGRGFSPLD